MGDYDKLISMYISNLNLSDEEKMKLLASKPTTLADVSLWLQQNATTNTSNSTNIFNPYSKDTKEKISKEIQLFSKEFNLSNYSSTTNFNNDTNSDSIDYSTFGLHLSNTNSSERIQRYSSATNTNKETKQTQTQQTANTQPTETNKKKEAEDNAIASIKENVNNAIETVMQQQQEEGIVSKAYGSVKEYCKSEMALSSVCRVIYGEQTTVDLLQLAQDKKLTKEEYYRRKIAEAIDLLAAGRSKGLSNEERLCLEERFSQYTPEELNELIDKIKYTNNDEYKKVTGQLDNLIEEGRKLLQKEIGDSNNIQINNPNSIKSLLKSSQSKELMTFEEVWKLERGVEFNADAITLTKKVQQNSPLLQYYHQKQTIYTKYLISQ